MEKIKKTSKKRPNPVIGFVKDYVSDFGFRQIATIMMFIAAIILFVGVFVSNETAITVGFYFYAAAALVGLIGCILTISKLKRRSPTFKRALFNLIVLSVLFVIAVLGIIFVYVNGVYVS